MECYYLWFPDRWLSSGAKRTKIGIRLCCSMWYSAGCLRGCRCINKPSVQRGCTTPAPTPSRKHGPPAATTISSLPCSSTLDVSSRTRSYLTITLFLSPLSNALYIYAPSISVHPVLRVLQIHQLRAADWNRQEYSALESLSMVDFSSDSALTGFPSPPPPAPVRHSCPGGNVVL